MIMKLQLQHRHTLMGHRNTNLLQVSGTDTPQPSVSKTNESLLL